MSIPLNPATPLPPARLLRRPRDKDGRIVPACMATVNGEPDFRLVAHGAFQRAHDKRLCLVCDMPLSTWAAFVLPGTGVITHTATEPPSHRTCLLYTLKVCPFLTDPDAKRRDDGLEDAITPTRLIHEHPGAVALFVTDSWDRSHTSGLFSIRNPVEVTWWTRARRATYPEALDALVTGLARLRVEAADLPDPGQALTDQDAHYARALELLPGNAA